MKICGICKISKELTEFGKKKSTLDGLRNSCKDCRNKYEKELKIKNPEPAKISNKKCTQKESFKVKRRIKNKKDRIFIKNNDPEKYKKIRLQEKNRKKRCKEKNPERHRFLENERRKRKFKRNLNYRLKCLLRNRIKTALSKNTKSIGTVKGLGCSLDFFKKYLESKFQEGMNWENRGKWHIDHIIPLSKFDLSNKDQFMKACHYTNLQPLWAIDNILKGAK